ncbi:cytochrome c biogenesis CcdA family protein [Halanaerobium salsuginis]|uniref:Cytochrome c-type biogenesis protein n=1 Tax=Halanaerobium salsuginis TaxID=29563 RepID=A0A1I4FQ50_9FIRM|nr:cytochrome c biogenesis protein CcdA [Halanaerobium salsuginis]SFL18721.1 cytochrome c-type biogenesis protein [Halanaerobium salsuginis]
MSIDISLLTAFSAGILSFFSPCILPLIPTYLAYLVADYSTKEKQSAKLTLLISAASFITGFTIIFVLLGLSATLLGKFLLRNQLLLTRLGGLIIIVFGLHLTGLITVSSFYQEKKLNLPDSLTGNLKAFLLGIILALGWTPCIGPIFSSILIIAGTKSSLSSGAILLLFYALGLAIPFLITAIFMEQLLPRLKKFNQYLPLIKKLTGILLIIFGLLMITGYLEILNRLLL